MNEMTWRLERSLYFFPSRMDHADSCIQQPNAYATTTLSHYRHLPNRSRISEPYLPNRSRISEPYLPNGSRMSEPNSPKRNEVETRTESKTSAALPCKSCTLRIRATEKLLRCTWQIMALINPRLVHSHSGGKNKTRMFRSPSHFVL